MSNRSLFITIFCLFSIVVTLYVLFGHPFSKTVNIIIILVLTIGNILALAEAIYISQVAYIPDTWLPVTWWALCHSRSAEEQQPLVDSPRRPFADETLHYEELPSRSV